MRSMVVLAIFGICAFWSVSAEAGVMSGSGAVPMAAGKSAGHTTPNLAPSGPTQDTGGRTGTDTLELGEGGR